MKLHLRYGRWGFYCLMVLFCVVVISNQTFCQKIDKSNRNYSIHQKIQFSDDDPQLTLDLYLPDSLKIPIPCIIVIQGGGFKSQNGERFRPFARTIVEHGFASALISYRGLPGYTYTTTLTDVKKAVRYIRRESRQYHINPDQIGAMGRSAGATLAVLLAVTGENRNPADPDHLDYTGRIQAAVGYAGVYDFVARFSDGAQISLQPGLNTKLQTNQNWIGAPYSPTDNNWHKASAINYVGKTTPPVLLLHCKDDSVVPWLQSQAIYEKMMNKGVCTEVIYFDKGGHGFSEGSSEQYWLPMMDFFKKQFRYALDYGTE